MKKLYSRWKNVKRKTISLMSVKVTPTPCKIVEKTAGNAPGSNPAIENEM